MCWSSEASFTVAAIGAAGVAVAVWRRDDPLLWVPLAYFTSMEVLQGVSYRSIGQCGLPENQVMAMLAYIHICFQPLFGFLLALHFIPDDAKRRFAAIGIALACGTAVYLLLQAYPFEWAGPCRKGRLLCSQQLCVLPGSWHLEWHIPMNDIGERVPALVFGVGVELQLPSYFLMMFVLPALMGSWKVVLVQFLLGPGIVWMLSDSPHERPAIWCILSVAIVLIVMFPAIRRHLYVRRWVGWS